MNLTIAADLERYLTRRSLFLGISKSQVFERLLLEDRMVNDEKMPRLVLVRNTDGEEFLALESELDPGDTVTERF